MQISSGKVALITGASSGIGAAFAKALAARRVSLVLVARREDRLRQLSDELTKTQKVDPNFFVTIFKADLTDSLQCAALFEFTNEKGIKVDLLINNAGFGLLGSVEQVTHENSLGMIDLNCRAVVDLTWRYLPMMKQRKSGGVIIVSSVVGAIPTPWFSVYAASKSFDLYFGEALSAECRGSGVDVLTVLPGLTSTEFQAGSGMREYHSPSRSAKQVVESALIAFGKKAIVVDGWLNKVLVHGSRLLPRSILMRVSRLVMKKELAL